ncbi:putative protein BRANCHLESS TRICHOME [Helianthus anomalus]
MPILFIFGFFIFLPFHTLCINHQVAPYNPVVTPRSSIEFRGGNDETGYSLKTSTELLKVLNII